jgi:hypothetical protein
MTSTFPQIRDQQWDGPAGCAFGCASECAARNIKVSPLVVFRELRQKAGRRDAASAASTNIGEVGEWTVELSVILVPDWESPPSVVAAFSRTDQTIGEMVII